MLFVRTLVVSATRSTAPRGIIRSVRTSAPITQWRSEDNTEFDGQDRFRGGDRRPFRPRGGRRDEDPGGFGAALLAKKLFDPDSAPVRVAHRQPEAASERDPEEVERYLEASGITVVAGRETAPKPALAFEEAGFEADLLERLADAGFDRPRPIQAAGWPVALAGKDLVAIGQTGSGKTLGYLLPALQAVLNRKAEGGRSRGGLPSALVMAPTRELAQQIEQVKRFITACRVTFFKRSLFLGV